MPKKSSAPYLGKVALFWCDHCQAPLLHSGKCQLCGGLARKVKISPPGDVRPAFNADYTLLQQTVNRQYGAPVGDELFAEHNTVLLNRVGGLDRSEEVILGGDVVGHFIFQIESQSYEFHPRLIGGWYLAQIIAAHLSPASPRPKAIWLNADGAAFFLKGKSILAPGFARISPGVEEGDHVLVFDDTSDKYLGTAVMKVGPAGLTGILSQGRGQIAKTRAYVKRPEIYQRGWPSPPDHSGPHPGGIPTAGLYPGLHPQISGNLYRAYRANAASIAQEVSHALRFITSTVQKHPHPIAVAYSGGKDSLGALLLAYRALGPRFKIFFADTGLELPEVVQNVHDVAASLGMADKLLIKDAGHLFWDLVQDFGPPGRDYRFCCHSLKAQQITALIEELYSGQKVLSFLGQRQYESLNRAMSKKVYVNSFIPLQVAATPIKSWVSLLLWLFILFEPVTPPNPPASAGSSPEDASPTLHVPVNPLYFAGHERLGCYLCPATTLATFESLKVSHPDLYARWFDFLSNYAARYGLPKAWVDMGLWRFKKYPAQWEKFMQEQGIAFKFHETTPHDALHLKVTKGFSPCLQSGYSVKARFSAVLDLAHICAFLPALTTQFEYDDELDVISGRGAYHKAAYRFNIFSDGSVFLHSHSASFDYASWFQYFYTTVYRALHCNQCKTCVSLCPVKAISLANGQVQIDPQLCTSCHLCISHCPLFQLSKPEIEKSFPPQ